MTIFDKRLIKKLWSLGFSASELALMYGVKTWKIYYVTRGIKRPERI